MKILPSSSLVALTKYLLLKVYSLIHLSTFSLLTPCSDRIEDFKWAQKPSWLFVWIPSSLIKPKLWFTWKCLKPRLFATWGYDLYPSVVKRLPTLIWPSKAILKLSMVLLGTLWIKKFFCGVLSMAPSIQIVSLFSSECEVGFLIIPLLEITVLSALQLHLNHQETLIYR